MEFTKRSGTTNKGAKYEDRFIAYLALKLQVDSNIKNFSLSSNNVKYGASFDDVVLEVETIKGPKVFAIQLKHANNPEKRLIADAILAERGDFSFKAYYKKLKESGTLTTSVEYVLFTNRKFSGKQKENDVSGIKIVEKKAHPLINTSRGRCYKFEVEEEEYQDFAKCFTLYTDQIDVDEIEKGLEEKFSNDKISVKEYLSYIDRWSNHEGRKSKLDKKIIKCVTTLSTLSKSLVPFSFRECVTNFKSLLLQALISHFKIVNCKSGNLGKIVQLYSNVLENDVEVRRTGIKYGIISEHENIDDEQRTKILWVMDKLPLIVNHTKNAQLCEDKQFIVLNDKENSKTLSNLEPGTTLYNQILDNFQCSIQGREKFTLRSLIEMDPKFATIISLNELLEMTNDTFNIGGEEEILPLPYISRRISTNAIDFRFLCEIKNDTLVAVCCQNPDQVKEHFNSLKKRESEDILDLDEEETHKETFHIIENVDEFEELCKKHPRKKNCHLFKYLNQELEWLNGTDLDDLKRHRTRKFVDESELRYSLNQKLHLICAEAGMGKSVFMKALKNYQPPTFWALVVDPRTGCFHDADEFFAHVLNTMSNFESKFLKILLEQHQVTFIWDGLDEIPKAALGNVIRIIKELSRREFLQFVSARSSLEQYLERQLCVLAKNIEPFNKEDQERYIKNRLGSVQENDAILGKVPGMLAVPLHAYLTTEVILQELEHKERVSFKKIISVADLYDRFVDMKFDFYFLEKTRFPTSCDIMKEDRLDNYERVALNQISPEWETECHSFLKKIEENGDPFGIITSVTDAGPSFIHHSFIDYFAAKHFTKNYTHRRDDIRNFLFTEKWKRIRLFFDLLLARDCPGHVALLSKNFEALQNCHEEAKMKDLAGRTLLHLACSWGKPYHVLDTKRKGINTYMVDVRRLRLAKRENLLYRTFFTCLLETCDPYETDGLFEMNAFAYANQFRCLLPMILLAKARNLEINTFDNFRKVPSILVHCVKFDYWEIFDVLCKIPYVVTKTGKRSLLHLGAIYNSANCVRKLLTYKIHRKNLNSGDAEHYSPMMSACRDSLDVVRLLIDTGIDLNAPCKGNGFTPLCAACRYGNLEIVKELMNNGASVRTLNKHGSTPIFQACVGDHIDVIKYLVNQGSDIEHRDYKSLTPLLNAAFYGSIQAVKFLINLGSSVNQASNKGITPLHQASSKGHLEIAEILIQRGAKINSKSDKNWTPLHLAVQTTQVRLVQLLIEKGSEIDVPTTQGSTPLQLACSQGNEEVVQTLILAGADTKVLNKAGETLLFAACRGGHVKVVRVLLDHGLDINRRNAKNQTPVYAACKANQFKVVKMLIEAGAEAKIEYRLGFVKFSYYDKTCETFKFLFIDRKKTEEFCSIMGLRHLPRCHGLINNEGAMIGLRTICCVTYTIFFMNVFVFCC